MHTSAGSKSGISRHHAATRRTAGDRFCQWSAETIAPPFALFQLFPIEVMHEVARACMRLGLPRPAMEPLLAMNDVAFELFVSGVPCCNKNIDNYAAGTQKRARCSSAECLRFLAIIVFRALSCVFFIQ